MGKSVPGLLSHTHQQAGKLGTPTQPFSGPPPAAWSQAIAERSCCSSKCFKKVFVRSVLGSREEVLLWKGGGGMLEALCKSLSGSRLGSMALRAIPGGQRQRPMFKMVPSPDFVLFFM